MHRQVQCDVEKHEITHHSGDNSKAGYYVNDEKLGNMEVQ